MALLITGLALFVGLHLVRRLAPGIPAAFPGQSWKGVVSLGSVIAIYIMTLGWPDASPARLWEFPGFVNHIVVLLMIPCFILFFGTHPGSALRARMRHPQLTGFKAWAILHLIANGEVRSVVLFGSLLAWAVVQVIITNRTSPAFTPPTASENPIVAWLAIPIGLAVWATFLFFAHEWLFGVYPLA